MWSVWYCVVPQMKRAVIEHNENKGVRVEEGAVVMLEGCTVRENGVDYQALTGGRIEGIDQSLVTVD